MNLLYGEIMDLRDENGAPNGRVRVGGAVKRVALDLVPEAHCGDRVLVCDGVAIGMVRPAPAQEDNYVSGHTWKTH